jgi:hypothetical protein
MAKEGKFKQIKALEEIALQKRIQTGKEEQKKQRHIHLERLSYYFCFAVSICSTSLLPVRLFVCITTFLSLFLPLLCLSLSLPVIHPSPLSPSFCPSHLTPFVSLFFLLSLPLSYSLSLSLFFPLSLPLSYSLSLSLFLSLHFPLFFPHQIVAEISEREGGAGGTTKP